ncbi:MAG TPA: ABC transporter ATP-binding protein [Candidatus Dormibacteraeota bacterium]|nr:ABC transporter ATP-binding protein [Candidatus Dormibacteraeota bacterium]
MIEILAEQVTKRLGGKLALAGVSVAVPAGALWGLVGADGAGKTTLLRCIAGLLRLDGGRVAPGAAGQSRIGFAQQGFHLYSDLRVDENIQFFGTVYGMTERDLAARSEELLSFAGLSDRRSTFAGELSGGMKQKLTLVCSILHRPPVLLLDEPTTGVDPLSRLEFWDLVEQLRSDGSTILLASAYFDEVERCDEVVYLSEGRVLAGGPPARLRGDHASLEDAFLALTA